MSPPLATVNIPFASISPNSNIATTSLEPVIVIPLFIVRSSLVDSISKRVYSIDEFDDDDESEEGSKGDTANSHGTFNFDDADDVDKVPETELDDPLEQNENSSKDPFGIYYLTKNKDNDC
ncbi:hypothetical protein Tco_0432221 [Tanacetum coccineum]